MKKWFLILMAAIVALPIFGSSVLAEEAVVYEDGTYEVPLTVKYGENVFEQFSEQATVEIEAGEQYIQFGHTQTNYILDVTVPFGEIDILNEDEENATREVGFAYSGDLNEPVPFSVHMFYGQTHDMQAYLDMSNVPVVEEVEEEPVTEPEPTELEEEPVTEEPEAEAEDPVVPEEESAEEEAIEEEEIVEEEEESNVPEKEETAFFEAPADAQYIEFVTESPAVNRQFDNPAVVFEQDGKTYIHLSGSGAEYFKHLAINGNEVTWGEIAEDGSFTVQFEHPGSLSDELVMNMIIAAGPQEMDHDVPFSFDENSMTPIAGKEEEVEDEPAEEDEEVTEEPVSSGEANEEAEVTAPSQNAFTINFDFLQGDNDAISAADGFFKKPAVLYEENSETFVQITSTNPEFIDALVAQFGNTSAPFELVKENADGSAVYQFKLPNGYDLSQPIPVKMVITVPGLPGYDGKEHDTRLALYENTLERISSVEEFDDFENQTPQIPEVDSTTGGSSLDPNTPEKPELGDAETKAANAQANDASALNPKTGEETNVLLYVLLLIASAIPLAIQVKKRFA